MPTEAPSILPAFRRLFYSFFFSLGNGMLSFSSILSFVPTLAWHRIKCPFGKIYSPTLTSPILFRNDAHTLLQLHFLQLPRSS
jgi:hypothetical protein